MAGRPREKSSDDILKAVRDARGPVATANEVADQVGYTPRNARDRLYELVDAGLLDMKKAGNTPVFWITPAGETALNSGE